MHLECITMLFDYSYNKNEVQIIETVLKVFILQKSSQLMHYFIMECIKPHRSKRMHIKTCNFLFS